MKIELSSYNPDWVLQFENEKKEIANAFSISDFTIEHIGSTAIPNLASKPIIDLLIGIPSLSFADECIKSLQKLNYSYVDAYNAIIPERRYFHKENKDLKSFHIHMVEKDSDFWKRHLFFRDYLRQHPEKKLEYENLKKQLAEKEWENRNDYANAKADFINAIDTFRSDIS